MTSGAPLLKAILSCGVAWTVVIRFLSELNGISFVLL